MSLWRLWRVRSPKASSSDRLGPWTSLALKLHPDKPSPKIQAQPGPYVGPFHWENRRLRVPEVRRLFGFPDDFELVGSRNSVQAQLGNCVPPPLAKAVAKKISDAL